MAMNVYGYGRGGKRVGIFWYTRRNFYFHLRTRWRQYFFDFFWWFLRPLFRGPSSQDGGADRAGGPRERSAPACAQCWQCDRCRSWWGARSSARPLLPEACAATTWPRPCTVWSRRDVALRCLGTQGPQWCLSATLQSFPPPRPPNS